MEYKEIVIFLVAAVEGLIIYIFTSHKKHTKEEMDKLHRKIEKIEEGDFIEKTTKNVIYSPESRSYFKAIFNEALNHKNKNNDSVNLAILTHLESIESKIQKMENGKSF